MLDLDKPFGMLCNFFVHVACARYAALKSHLVCVGVCWEESYRLSNYKIFYFMLESPSLPTVFSLAPTRVSTFLDWWQWYYSTVVPIQKFSSLENQLVMPFLCLRMSVVLEWAIDTHCHMKMPLTTSFEKRGLYNLRRFNLSQVSHGCYISIAC